MNYHNWIILHKKTMKIKKKYITIILLLLSIFFSLILNGQTDKIFSNYEKGLEYYFLKQYELSLKYFRNVYISSPNYKKIDDLYKKSLIKSGNKYLENKNYKIAVKYYSEYLSHFENNEIRIKLYYSLLLSGEDVSDWSEYLSDLPPADYDFSNILENELKEHRSIFEEKKDSAKVIIYNYYKLAKPESFILIKDIFIFIIIICLAIVSVLLFFLSKRIKIIIKVKEFYDDKHLHLPHVNFPEVNVSAVKEKGVKILHAVSSNKKTLSMRRVYKIGKTVDKFTDRKNHNIRVGNISYKIAEAMNIDEDEALEVQKIGFIHDLGYIKLVKSLKKEGKTLETAEYVDIYRHIDYGIDVLKRFDVSEIFYEGLKYHHERWDGSGYPEGLKGEEIPLVARIISISDFFVTITTSSEKRTAVSSVTAIEILKRLSGKHFDPDIVNIVSKIDIDSKELQ